MHHIKGIYNVPKHGLKMHGMAKNGRRHVITQGIRKP